MANSTPGPWFLAEELQPNGNCLSRAVMAPDSFVAEVLLDDEDDAQGEANAAFIVRACNSHYELLEALVEILGPLNVCSDNPNVRDDTILPVDMTMGELRKARAALSRATEGGA